VKMVCLFLGASADHPTGHGTNLLRLHACSPHLSQLHQFPENGRRQAASGTQEPPITYAGGSNVGPNAATLDNVVLCLRL